VSHRMVQLDFHPLPGCTSAHIQTIFAGLVQPGKGPPSSTSLIIPLEDGDSLSCEISTPSGWQPTDATIAMVHGMCGDQDSSYMVRLSRKLYELGYRAVRINLRACGSGQELAKLPYHGGVSFDVLKALEKLQQETPYSPLILIGFSLGGNIAVKLIGELGAQAKNLLKGAIAVCAPLDLARTAALLSEPRNMLYNRYYVNKLQKQAQKWLNNRTFSNIYEFDALVTAPQWGFKDPMDYYEKCSGYKLLANIQLPCYLLYAADDPFVDYSICTASPVSQNVLPYITQYGGHMGFFGWADENHRYFWLDYQLLHWIKELL
jgi:uncharacterized protein